MSNENEYPPSASDLYLFALYVVLVFAISVFVFGWWGLLIAPVAAVVLGAAGYAIGGYLD